MNLTDVFKVCSEAVKSCEARAAVLGEVSDRKGRIGFRRDHPVAVLDAYGLLDLERTRIMERYREGREKYPVLFFVADLVVDNLNPGRSRRIAEYGQI